MKCKQVNLLLEDYTNHNLPAKQMHNLKQHLEQCEQCQKEYQFFKKYQQTLKKAEVRKAPRNFLANVHAKIDETQRRKSFWQFFTLRQMEFVGAVVVVVVIFLFVFPFQNYQIKESKISTKQVTKQKQKIKSSGSVYKKKRTKKSKPVVPVNVRPKMYNIHLVLKNSQESVITEKDVAMPSTEPVKKYKSYSKSSARAVKSLKEAPSVQNDAAFCEPASFTIVKTDSEKRKLQEAQIVSNVVHQLSGYTKNIQYNSINHNIEMNIILPLSNYQSFMSNLKRNNKVKEIKIDKETVKIIESK